MKEQHATTFRGIFESVRGTLPYMVEGAILGFTDQIVNRMDALGLARNALANRIGTSPAYVSKFLGGGTNFTLESMVKVAEALDSELRIEVVPRDSIKSWIDVVEKASPLQCADLRAWMGRCRLRGDGVEAAPVSSGAPKQPVYLNEAS